MNVLLIVMDDLGWRDVSYEPNSLVVTPSIDRLAESGMKFSQAYAAAPICSASRASILTGKSTARTHFEFVTKWPGDQVSQSYPLTPPPFTFDLPLDEVTVAELLRDAGVQTALAGKWHVAAHHGRYNGWSPTHGPKQQGFVTAIDECGAHLTHSEQNVPAAKYTTGEYPPDALTERTIEQLAAYAHDDKQFFMFLSHYYVHIPMGNIPKWAIEAAENRLLGRASNEQIRYAAFVAQADHYVGQVLNALETLGLQDNTVVIFTADNGGDPELSSHVPLRGAKWNLYEAGIRVPMIVRWPGVTAPGSICGSPVSGYDLLPTICEIQGVAVEKSSELDGRSLASLLAGNNDVRFEERALFWHYPYYVPEVQKPDAANKIGVDTNTRETVNPPSSAMRAGRYKLLYFYEDERSELYDLVNDPSEKTDLSSAFPDITDKWLNRLQEYLNSTRARIPTASQ
ncbi:sulfatase [Aeoliella sp. SH292]|uniref:sulfatase n=1 Tax=Aeoliella sp. SH292 TaxID=3454464 RepID=UPI003F99BC1D